MGAGQIFNLPRTDDFSRRGKVPSHLTAKVVSTVAFQNKIKNLSCTRKKFTGVLSKNINASVCSQLKTIINAVSMF